MSTTDQNGSDGAGEDKSPERVVTISVLPVSVSMRAPMVDRGGGKISYSNHDIGLTGIPLGTPIEFVVGDRESENRAINLMVAAINIVARAVALGFQSQTDRLVWHDPTQPSPPDSL